MKNGTSGFPIIASITKEEQIEIALKADVRRVNLITGNIMNLKEVVQRLHDADKMVFVHIEMVNGLGRDHAAVQYLAQTFKVDGIISTKSGIISAARQANLRTIQRVFAIDSSALETAEKMITASNPDEVELMPALMPRVIREMKARVTRPLIVGGLIRYREEIESALENGADYVSAGDTKFWNNR